MKVLVMEKDWQYGKSSEDLKGKEMVEGLELGPGQEGRLVGCA